jgi:C-terminal processing protease CtpA/Prc
MSEQALFAELTRMLETLRDGHLTIISPLDTSSYNGFYTGFPRNFSFDNILRNYLTGLPRRQGPILYDSQDGVGYIYYKQFSSMLNLNDLRIVMESLADTKGLIVDVRDNTGGYIQAADRMASVFIKEPLIVKFEQFKSGTGREQFSDPLKRTLQPEGIYYPGRVIVLTNRSCFSACNDFVLYTKSMPQVKQYGDQTGGGGSIPSSYRLANGWFVQFSSSRTLSPALQSVEMGILPDRNLEIGVLDDLRGRDPILEAAFLDLR